jgi:hypothetical protein
MSVSHRFSLPRGCSRLSRRRSRTLWQLVAAALCLLALGSGSAAATQITGFSDQSYAHWDAAADSVSDSLGIQQVRLVTPWDVALHPAPAGGCAPTDGPCNAYVIARDFIAKAQAHGKQVLVSFDHTHVLPAPVCAPGDAAPCPDGNYRYAIDRFRSDFPDVTEFTAWNEPNHHPHDSTLLNPANPSQAPTAAAYWNQLDAACQIASRTGKKCTVAAGDFLDGSDPAGLSSYTTRYQAALHRTPDVWAVHPYHSVDANDLAILPWVEGQTQGRPVWFTEVGAYDCLPDQPPFGLSYQAARASNLERLMQSVTQRGDRVDRVYYYFLAARDGSESCPAFDTGLIGASDTPRPALSILFPQLGAPIAHTTSASSIGVTKAVLEGTLDQHAMITTAYFEYSTGSISASAAIHGSTRARKLHVTAHGGLEQASAFGVSAGVSGLQPNTTYHCRFVAKNLFGTSVGEEQTFTTVPTMETNAGPATLDAPSGAQAFENLAGGSLVSWMWDTTSWKRTTQAFDNAPGTTPSLVHDSTIGRQWVFYVDNASTLTYQWFDGQNWNLVNLGSSVMPGTSPSAIEDPVSGNLWVYYVTSSGTLASWWWDNSSWHSSQLGASVKPGTSPAAVRDPNWGGQWIYFVDSAGKLAEMNWNTATWTLSSLQSPVQAGASPSVVYRPGWGTFWVYYPDASGQLAYWYWDSQAWHQFNLGGTARPGSSPTATGQPMTGEQWMYYVDANNGIQYFYWNGSSWFGSSLGGQVKSGTSPATVADADRGTVAVYYTDSNGGAAYANWDGAAWHFTTLGP